MASDALLIHVQLANGEQQICTEAEVRDHLSRKIFTPDMYFWREGMAEWRPLSALPPPPAAYSIAPPRRDSMPEPTAKPAPDAHVPRGPVDVSAQKTGSSRRITRRYFETDPTFLIILLQSIGGLMLLCAIYTSIAGISAIQAGTALPGDGKSPLMIMVYVTGALEVLFYVTFFFWVYHINLNCHGFTSNMHFTPGWAVGWFFVPLLNCFRPYQVMQEIWKVSRNPRSWLGQSDSLYVGVWFGLLLVCGITARGFRTSYEQSTDPGLQTLGLLANLIAATSSFAVMELATMILTLVITLRQFRWVRGGE